MNRRGFLGSAAAAAAGAIASSHIRSGDSKGPSDIPGAGGDGLEPVTEGPLAENPGSYQANLDSLGVVGYADKISVKPGESVSVAVSTKAASYTAQLMRVQHGDVNPQGPGLKETPVPSSIDGTHPGSDQRLHLGSYVRVDNPPELTGDFTITARIAATTVPGSDLVTEPIELQWTPTYQPRVQALITRWDDSNANGYGLFIDENGAVALFLGRGSGPAQRVSTNERLAPWAPALKGVQYNGSDSPQVCNQSGWYFVAATYQAATGHVTVRQVPYQQMPDNGEMSVDGTVSSGRLARVRKPLLMAAHWNGDQPAGFFNGKIDSPQIYDRVLSDRELAQVQHGATLHGARAAWDFAREVATTRVVDPAGGHHGVTINLPVRALTGPNWTATEQCWRLAPDEYGAMQFHEDDLGDTGWDKQLTVRIPADAKSGYYGVKLVVADHNPYYAMFVVRPKKPAHKVAFIVPTFTYMAYGQTGGTFNYSASLYSHHADGSPVMYSSHLRPIVDYTPYRAGTPWAYVADTHITDWLESTGRDVDYITDHDLDAHGRALIDHYKVLITGTHPEYISAKERAALKSWLNDGGRLMYLGGNGYYWVTSVDRTGMFTELRRHDGTEAWSAGPGEYYHATTGEFGGLWRFRGLPPNEIVGVGFTAQNYYSVVSQRKYGRPFDRSTVSYEPQASWVFDGVSTTKNIGATATLQEPGGPYAEEIDRADYALGTPANAVVLGSATGFDDSWMFVVEEVNWSGLLEGGTDNPLVRGDLLLSFYPNRGAVFAASSMTWSGGLYYNKYRNDVATITGNVYDTFLNAEELPNAPK
jgi:N,N-dimethylformamidase